MKKLKSLAITPRYQAESSWWEHVPIAHLLIELLEPDVVVELGSHYGVSFFAFCEASEIMSNNTYVYAIDSWEGDIQAGYYDDSVYQMVKGHRDKYHKQRSALIKERFDDALNHFEDKSIDLLHIDGLHTYDAVKHDYEQWLPKLKVGGSIIFHDWNERKDGFGVWRLWDEIKRDEKFKCIQFANGHGLGIATLSPTKPIWHDTVTDHKDIIICKGILLSKINDGQRRSKHQDEVIGELEKHINNLQQMCDSKSKEIQEAIEQIKQMNNRLGLTKGLIRIKTYTVRIIKRIWNS